MRDTELKFTVAVHLSNHKYAPGTISKMKTWKTLSGTSVMWFTQIVPGAMSAPSLNSVYSPHKSAYHTDLV